MKCEIISYSKSQGSICKCGQLELAHAQKEEMIHVESLESPAWGSCELDSVSDLLQNVIFVKRMPKLRKMFGRTRMKFLSEQGTRHICSMT